MQGRVGRRPDLGDFRADADRDSDLFEEFAPRRVLRTLPLFNSAPGKTKRSGASDFFGPANEENLTLCKIQRRVALKRKRRTEQNCGGAVAQGPGGRDPITFHKTRRAKSGGGADDVLNDVLQFIAAPDVRLNDLSADAPNAYKRKPKPIRPVGASRSYKNAEREKREKVKNRKSFVGNELCRRLRLEQHESHEEEIEPCDDDRKPPQPLVLPIGYHKRNSSSSDNSTNALGYCTARRFS